jgi:predicted nucleotidyltransferase
MNPELAEARSWFEKTNYSSAYIFGSLIHRDGIQFLKDRSDVDLVALFEEKHGCLERVDCMRRALPATHELNLRLLARLGRVDAANSITSVLSATASELLYGIHKDGSREFFSHNDFQDIATGQTSKLGDTARHPATQTEP